ncbi:peptide chain release factor N(5)-glutamine methyltransferase [Bacteriovoracaceae bacterium]|nr:peptide chain release factor N(5)-glutamine methyltransferase [Bacteriovoracaceae bacterium]
MDQFFLQNIKVLSENYPGLNTQNYQDFINQYQKKHNLGFFINDESIANLKECLLAGIPFSYLLKSHYFYNHEMYIDESVLIPRFETEILVFEALEFIKNCSLNEVSIADVCTGSGCIINAIQIESDKNLKGIAVDLDVNALKIAKYNNFLIGHLKNKKHNIEFSQSDRLSSYQEQKFNLILSNPPYIKESQRDTTVHKNVHTYEPHIALYLGDEIYMDWFDLFFTQAYNCLFDGGIFLMEGDSNHLEFLANILDESKSLNVSLKLKKDLAGRTRYLEFKKG